MATDPAILFVKPKAISPADKRALQATGVIVVEVADPQAVKFVRPCAELSGSEMLEIACEVIANRSSSSVREAFGDGVAQAYLKKREPQ